MVAYVRQRLLRSLPLYGAVAGGVIAALAVMLMPTAVIETLVWTTGVAALVPAAQPPLGLTARVLLALGSGALVAALLWSSLFLLFGPGGLFTKRAPREDGVPVIRRADAHPDAPPRRPMSAADLGTPMMEVGIGGVPGGARDERTIPVDLDLPLAAFDPNAILPVPMEPVRPVMPLAQPTLIQSPLVQPVVIQSSLAQSQLIQPPPVQPPLDQPPLAQTPLPQPKMVAPVIAVSPVAEPATFVTAPSPKPVETPRGSPRQPVEAPEVEMAAPTPIARPPRAPAEPSTPPTIEALLQRLEQGAGRRGRIGSH